MLANVPLLQRCWFSFVFKWSIQHPPNEGCPSCHGSCMWVWVDLLLTTHTQRNSLPLNHSSPKTSSAALLHLFSRVCNQQPPSPNPQPPTPNPQPPTPNPQPRRVFPPWPLTHTNRSARGPQLQELAGRDKKASNGSAGFRIGKPQGSRWGNTGFTGSWCFLVASGFRLCGCFLFLGDCPIFMLVFEGASRKNTVF